jgi:hypothetical protein
VTVTVVLDTSAVLAYAKGSVAIGELLSIITDDGDTVLIPATCLAVAARHLAETEEVLLGVLSTVPCVAVAPLTGDQAVRVGAVVRRSESGQAARRATSVDRGHAVVEAVDRGAQLATANEVTMRRLLPADWPVIPV